MQVGQSVNERIALVIFDWDGTVVDSTPTITQAIREVVASVSDVSARLAVALRPPDLS